MYTVIIMTIIIIFIVNIIVMIVRRHIGSERLSFGPVFFAKYIVLGPQTLVCANSLFLLPPHFFLDIDKTAWLQIIVGEACHKLVANC